MEASRASAAPSPERSVGPRLQNMKGSAEPWRSHVLLELKLRDRKQQQHREMITAYTRLLEKLSVTFEPRSSLTSSAAFWSGSALHQHTLSSSGELAYQVVELQRLLKVKEREEEEQRHKLQVEKQWLQGRLDARQALQERVEQLQEENELLRVKYDTLLQQQQWAELQVRAEIEREAKLLTRSKVAVESFSSDHSHGTRRLFRSASLSSPGFFSTFRRLFEKRRGHFVSTKNLLLPVGRLSVRLPARALHVLEAHDQGINAVKFSLIPALLATGGTDRVVKLWEVQSGSLTHRANLAGSTGGITCVQFDQTGSRVLAATYDKSALLWRVNDCNLEVTLTGHSRKVTAARFTGSHQAVTGGADGTIRVWDLNRAACVQRKEVESYCSDVVCSESFIISGHYDSKIRVWDNRAESCVQELPAQGRVTSLDLSLDQWQLLSCCRDNLLQVVDLRGRSYERMCLRDEGFKCGSDSTKAVMSPDGCFVAAGSADGAVYIWILSTGSLETRLPNNHSCPISAVSWSSCGDFVVSVDKSRRAVLWSDI